MKTPTKHLSYLVCWLVFLVSLLYRYHYPQQTQGKVPLVTQWDAMGYYDYLPGFLIYDDLQKMAWVKEIDEKYHVTGNGVLPVVQLPNGHVVNKYFAGVAFMQLPLFSIAHVLAPVLGYPPDGFSAPYQLALGYGILLYLLVALLLLRKVLLHYYSDKIVAATLLLLCLATNYLQYAAVDNGQSHAYLFCVYCFLLFATQKWHQSPTIKWAISIGASIGLAIFCRPTEAISIFIPLLWSWSKHQLYPSKWTFLKRHPAHLFLAALAGSLFIFIQMLYWKHVSGNWIFDVGSSWRFLTPFFRVLIGFEKGWFIYTPITILFVLGLLRLKGFPFKQAVLVFSLLNIWIVISWADWRYGGSYSTRALMQSYPVWALALGALLYSLREKRFRYLLVPLCSYFIMVNLFQLHQYNATVLHYNDMNFSYYKRIYLNPSPTPLDFSLLDVPFAPRHTNEYLKEVIISQPEEKNYSSTATNLKIAEGFLYTAADTSYMLRITLLVKAPASQWQQHLQLSINSVTQNDTSNLRLLRPMVVDTAFNAYDFYMPVDMKPVKCHWVLQLPNQPQNFHGILKNVQVVLYKKAK